MTDDRYYLVTQNILVTKEFYVRAGSGDSAESLGYDLESVDERYCRIDEHGIDSVNVMEVMLDDVEADSSGFLFDVSADDWQELSDV
jgi:hypothetical protein